MRMVLWLMTRDRILRERLASGCPDLVADFYLYPTSEGGKATSAVLGWGAPCMSSKTSAEAWDGYPLLESEMKPGDRRRVGFVFLSGQSAINALTVHDQFYINEGRIVGEATIVR